MLFQLPRGPAEAARASNSQEVSAFEEGLRRDLASAPVVHYDPVLGGWRKRALDLLITLLFAPVWLPALAFVAVWAKAQGVSEVFHSENRVGYGGRAFRLRLLRVERPRAEVTALHAQPADASVPANDLGVAAEEAEDRPAKWMRFFERLPQAFNVLTGDMSLVGAVPVTDAELEGLRTGRRYYLSARPGVFDISHLVRPENREGRFKAYALSWSLITDLLLMWDGVRGFCNRGELWRPGLNLNKAAVEPTTLRRRRAS